MSRNCCAGRRVAPDQAHSAERAEQVDGDRLRTPPAVVEQDMLEEKSLASTRALHDPVGNLGDLQAGPHRMGDSGQLTDSVDGLDELPEVV